MGSESSGKIHKKMVAFYQCPASLSSENIGSQNRPLCTVFKRCPSSDHNAKNKLGASFVAILHHIGEFVLELLLSVRLVSQQTAFKITKHLRALSF